MTTLLLNIFLSGCIGLILTLAIMAIPYGIGWLVTFLCIRFPSFQYVLVFLTLCFILGLLQLFSLGALSDFVSTIRSGK